MDPQLDPNESTYRLRYETRWGHRLPGGLWLLGLLLVPIMVAALGSALFRNDIETQLTDQALEALEAEGIDKIHVVFDARDATLQIPYGVEVSPADLARAVKVVEAIDGVRVVNASDAALRGAGTVSSLPIHHGWLAA